MLLAIDIGNTNIHIGTYKHDRWCCSWRARTLSEKMADEYAVLLRSFFTDAGLGFQDVSHIIAASVVPDLTSTFRELCRRYLELDPLFVTSETNIGVAIKVDNPREVGADRIVNAAAVHALYGGPAIIVDFGTATTLDVVDAEGSYIGGTISPGIGLAHDALVHRAALLRSVELKPPQSVIGKNTEHAMQSGLFTGYSLMIEGLINGIRQEMDARSLKVIATGGLASVFDEYTRLIDIVSPNLTLEGLRIIWELNQN